MEDINYIKAEIEIKENAIKNIRIINSFEEFKRENVCHNIKNDYKYKNEKEIKKKCRITINEERISFSYFYTFRKKGKYLIKYSFIDNIIKTNYMFSECKSLTNIDLSNFNTQHVTNMSYMFNRCNSLTNIDLSNFNTQNVTNMKSMFYSCTSLTNIDLSNFNTLWV